MHAFPSLLEDKKSATSVILGLDSPASIKKKKASLAVLALALFSKVFFHFLEDLIYS